MHILELYISFSLKIRFKSRKPILFVIYINLINIYNDKNIIISELIQFDVAWNNKFYNLDFGCETLIN